MNAEGISGVKCEDCVFRSRVNPTVCLAKTFKQVNATRVIHIPDPKTLHNCEDFSNTYIGEPKRN